MFLGISGEYSVTDKEIKELYNLKQKRLYGCGKFSVFYSRGSTYVLYWRDDERTATSAAAIRDGKGREEHRVSLPQRQRAAGLLLQRPWKREEVGSEVEKPCLGELIFHPFSDRAAQWNNRGVNLFLILLQMVLPEVLGKTIYKGKISPGSREAELCP